jgi:hypothetical protein
MIFKIKTLIMKTRSFFSLLILLVFLPSVCAIAQKADISGEWKMNRQKSTVDEQLFLSGITILFRSDSLITTRHYENGNGEEYPFDENISLDGKECKITIFDMPRTSTSTRSATDGSVKISSATTFSGGNGQEDMVAKENWKLDSTGKILILEFINTMSGNEVKGTYYYDRVK